MGPASRARPARRAGVLRFASNRLPVDEVGPKATEFFVYIAAVVAVLIASMAVSTEDDHRDYFRADQACLYIVILTVGYMISRGLAKSGNRDNYDGS
ncbi:hypothetical protein [Streptomyces sp. NPDC058612]|uniref:hypothetical protein n=1 Tax=Streptomyces sp. NPDC058612 TaxID=3346555 RepID=UPI00365248E4